MSATPAHGCEGRGGVARGPVRCGEKSKRGVWYRPREVLRMLLDGFRASARGADPDALSRCIEKIRSNNMAGLIR
jgi:hypothetical protein